MRDPTSGQYQTRMRDLPPSERPRERLRDAGPGMLSNAELIAILLRTGSSRESALSLANRLLAQFQGLGGLARAGFNELLVFRGLGDAKAAQVMAALELGKRITSLPADERPSVGSPQDVYNLFAAEMALLEQESMRVLLLNTKNQVLRTVEVYKGTVSAVAVRAGEALRHAVRENSPSVIILHNHPSGDPTPSNEDVQITKQLVDAGRMLDVEVLDHVVIGRRGFVSMKERKLGFG